MCAVPKPAPPMPCAHSRVLVCVQCDAPVVFRLRVLGAHRRGGVYVQVRLGPVASSTGLTRVWAGSPGAVGARGPRARWAASGTLCSLPELRALRSRSAACRNSTGSEEAPSLHTSLGSCRFSKPGSHVVLACCVSWVCNIRGGLSFSGLSRPWLF